MIKKHCIICNRKNYAKGFCVSHYNKLRAGRPLQSPLCKIPHCGAEVKKHLDVQLCSYHYHNPQGGKTIYKKDGGKWGYKDYRKIQLRQKERCDICAFTKKLIIHHKDGNNRNSNWDNLMTLCRKCHTDFHYNNLSLNNITINKY